MLDYSVFELYVVAVYFTMQTLTTVGYGDISISSSQERFIVIILQFLGIIFFSFASGSLTNIIVNYDSSSTANKHETMILNKILKDYHIPIDLYIQILN